jgi:hypothetical protein
MGAPAYVQKRSKFQKDVDRYERMLARVKVAAKKKRAEIQAWAALREQVFLRDRGLCRATGKPLLLHGTNPYQVGQAHHIQWRGRQGKDVLENLIWVDPLVHELIHGRIVNASRRIDVTGDGNGTVHFTEIDLETGKTIREWDSECPT